MSAQRQRRTAEEATTDNLQQVVYSFLPFLNLSQSLKRLLGLQHSTLETFLCLVNAHYTNGRGLAVSSIMKLQYKGVSASYTRAIDYRLDTLIKHGLVYSMKVKHVNYYYLSDKAKGILEGINKGDKK